MMNFEFDFIVPYIDLLISRIQALWDVGFAAPL